MSTEALALAAPFKGLSNEDLQILQDAGGSARYAAGETVIREGETNRCLHVVMAGKLEACLPKSATRFTKITLAEMGPGGCVGEYSFVDGKPTSAAVVAADDSVVFTLALDDFERVSGMHHNIGMVIYRNLLTMLIDRLREDNAMLDMIRPQR